MAKRRDPARLIEEAREHGVDFLVTAKGRLSLVYRLDRKPSKALRREIKKRAASLLAYLRSDACSARECDYPVWLGGRWVR